VEFRLICVRRVYVPVPKLGLQCRSGGATRAVAEVTQQSSVEEADDGQRAEEGEREEAAVEEAADPLSGVRENVDVNTRRPQVPGVTVVDDPDPAAKFASPESSSHVRRCELNRRQSAGV